MAFRGNQYPEGISGNRQPPQRPVQARPRRRKPPRKREGWGVLTGFCGLAVIIVIVIEASHGSTSTSTSTTAATTGTPSASQAAVTACQDRKAGGELYVRVTEPGIAAQAQQVGGAWQWDYTTGACLDAVDWITTTAGTASGECTTVGYVADNPGYNPDATDPAPIRHLAGEAGPGC